MKEKLTIEDFRRLSDLLDSLYIANSRIRECIIQMESILIPNNINYDNKDN